MNIEELLADFNWKEAFDYAAKPNLAAGATCSVGSFARSDVAAVIASVEGQNDGDPWIGVFHLKDGRFASLSAWCDYTGWGCQEGGSSTVADSLEQIVQFGLTDQERTRLGFASAQP